MKKLLLFALIFSSMYLKGQEMSISDFPVGPSILLNNGNKLNFAYENLDDNTADSDCQCENVFSGTVYWVFETNSDYEIVNQNCITMDEWEDLFYIDLPIPGPGGSSNTVYDNRALLGGCLKDVFYYGEDIAFHYLENYAGPPNTHNPTGVSQLLIFDLDSFSFSDPINYPTYWPSSAYYGIIDKTIKINDNHLFHMYNRGVYTTDGGTLSATAADLEDNGYQLFYVQENEEFSPVVLYLSQSFQANADVVVLDYKKNSENNISFLVVTNALDGFYTDGVQDETSLFLVEVNFTNMDDLDFTIVKSDLEIPRNISLKYGDYNVFINDENNFVINVKPSQYEQESWDYFNSIHILGDTGGFETISLNNEFAVEWTENGATSWIAYPGNYQYDNGQLGTHQIIDIAFSPDTFLTLEKVANYQNSSLSNPTGQSSIIKLFNYDGIVLFRHVFSSIGAPGYYTGSSTNLIDERFLTYINDDISYIHWNFNNSPTIDLAFYGVEYNENTGYSIAYSNCSYLDNYLWTFSFDSALSIENSYEDVLEFDLRKNPVADNLIIEGLISLDLCVFNSLGQMLIEAKNTDTLDVSSLTKGVYYIKASDGTKSSTKKFIKN